MCGMCGTNAMMHTKPIASALLFLLTLPGAQAALPASTVFAGKDNLIGNRFPALRVVGPEFEAGSGQFHVRMLPAEKNCWQDHVASWSPANHLQPHQRRSATTTIRYSQSAQAGAAESRA